ncbi:MAG: hypothetical protein LBE59_05575 [Nevskiaceae bacterium]|nr:hypothetical protein [Nevskiaceae bacterium]
MPTGWSVRGEGEGVTFWPNDLKADELLEIWIGPPANLQSGVNLQSQLPRFRSAAGVATGSPCQPPQPVPGLDAIQQGCMGSDGIVLTDMLLHLGPPGYLPSQGRLLRMRTRGAEFLNRHVDGIAQTWQIAARGDQKELLKRHGLSEYQWKALQIEKAIHTAPGKGIADSQIVGIYVAQQYALNPVSNVFEYENKFWLLLKNGMAYRNPSFPPDEINAEASLKLEPDKWRQWRKPFLSDKYEYLTSNGEWASLGTGALTQPAPNGTRLSGEFSSYSNFGTMYTGMSSSRSSWYFGEDGRFQTSSSGTIGSGLFVETTGVTVSSTSSADAKGSRSSTSISGRPGSSTSTPVAAGGSSSSRSNDGSDRRGTYKIKGWVLELHRDNGQVDRLLISFSFPAKSGEGFTSVNIGTTQYFKPREKD